MGKSRYNRRILGYVLLAILWAFVIFYVWRIVSFYSIDLFNPPSGKTNLPMAIAYPPPINGELQPNWLQVNFVLEAESIIAENVDLKIASVSGFVSYLTNTERNISVDNVWIGFQYAQPWHPLTWSTTPDVWQDNFINPPPGDWLVTNFTSNQNGPPSEILQPLEEDTFHFSVAGDYSPSIIVMLHNVTFYEYTYDQIKVHVMSTSELQTQALGQVNGVVAIALLVFTFIESIVIVRDLTKHEEKRVISRTRHTLTVES